MLFLPLSQEALRLLSRSEGVHARIEFDKIRSILLRSISLISDTLYCEYSVTLEILVQIVWETLALITVPLLILMNKLWSTYFRISYLALVQFTKLKGIWLLSSLMKNYRSHFLCDIVICGGVIFRRDRWRSLKRSSSIWIARGAGLGRCWHYDSSRGI